MQSSTCKWQLPRKRLEAEAPSRKDGIGLKLENSTRRLALAFCQDVGFMLKMNQYTIATAMTYWQRFFMYQSLAKNDPYLVATACTLLAGKVEENFKSLQKITEIAYYVRHKKEAAAADRIKRDSKLLVAEMDKVTKAEEVLLVTLDFDFSVNHPYGPLWKVVKELGLNTKGDKAKEHFCQCAWNFSNDSLRTTLCIQPHSSMDIAVACINLTATAVKYELPATPNGKLWWARFGTTKENLKDIERQVMNLYKRRGEGGSSKTSGLSVPPTPSLLHATSMHRGTPSPSTGAGLSAKTEQSGPAFSGAPSFTRRPAQSDGSNAKSCKYQAGEDHTAPQNGSALSLELGSKGSAKVEAGSSLLADGAVESSAKAKGEVADGGQGEEASQKVDDEGTEGGGAERGQGETEGKRRVGGQKESTGQKGGSLGKVQAGEGLQEQEEVEMEVDEPEPAAQARVENGGEQKAKVSEVESGIGEGAVSFARELKDLEGDKVECEVAADTLAELITSKKVPAEIDEKQPSGEAVTAADEIGVVKSQPEQASKENWPTAEIVRENGDGSKGEEAGAKLETGAVAGEEVVLKEVEGKKEMQIEDERARAVEGRSARGKGAGAFEMDEELLLAIETVGPQSRQPETLKDSTQVKETEGAAQPVSEPGAEAAAPGKLVGPKEDILQGEASKPRDNGSLEMKAPAAEQQSRPGSEHSRALRMDKKRTRWELETNKEQVVAAAVMEPSKSRRSEDGKTARTHSLGKSEEQSYGNASWRGSSPGRRPSSPLERKRTLSTSPRRLPSPSRSGRSGGPSRERSPAADSHRHRRPSPDSTAAKAVARGRSPGSERDRHRRSPDGWRHGERRRDHEREDRNRGWDGHGRDSRHRIHGHDSRDKERDREREYERLEAERSRDHKEHKDKHRDADRDRERGRYQRGHGYH